MHLHFTQSLEPLEGAGLGQSALSLHLAMRKFGGSALVSTRSESFQSTWPDVVHGVRRGPTKLFFAPELIGKTREMLDGITVFHGHGFYVWLNAWLGGVARRTKRPLVYHAHGFLDPWILRRSRRKKQVAHWLFENANFRHAAWWRAVSAKEADQVRAYGITAPVHVIPNGVDLTETDASAPSEYATSHWTKKKQPHRVVFLSRIHPKKGLDLLIPGWATLRSSYPDWELLIVGPDEGGYQAVVEKLIADADCADTVVIHPAVTGPEKHALLRTADVFILPSYSEGFPMALLEAAAHSKPAVFTDECNFPELAAADGGWQCRPTIESVTAALKKALGCDASERRDRGQRARRLVETSYTWEHAARQVSEICAEPLRGSSE